MITQRGRVVYDRKRNYFKPKDLARILNTYSYRTTGLLFGEFVWNVVQLTLGKEQRTGKFIYDFWGSFWNHLVKKGVYDPESQIEELFGELVETVTKDLEKGAPEVEIPETSAERKRRLIEERK